METEGARKEAIKILVAEDSPTQAEHLRFILEKGGIKVSVASNGREALALFRRSKPDIVVADVVMPEIDGYELCRRIRKELNCVEMPIILVTALSDPTDVIRGLEVGANNFVTKPYDEKYLLSRIENLIANKELRRNLKSEEGIDLFFSGRSYHITAERPQILDLLLSTYENAHHQNRELLTTQRELTDLNERLEETVRELEEARAEAENDRRRLEAVMEALPVGMAITDDAGHHVKFNAAFERVWGERLLATRSPDGHVGTARWTETGEQVAAEEWASALVLSKGAPVVGQMMEIERADGSRVSVINSAAPVSDADGEVLGAAVVIEDITDLRRAEQAVLRAKQEWERTFDALPDLVAILDVHHRIVRVNRAMAERLGLRPDECIGWICHKQVHGLDSPPPFCPHVLTLSDGQEHAAEVHEDCLGGDFLVTTSPLTDLRGQRIGSVHVARDITDRKRMEEELRASRDQLELRVQERTIELREAYDRLLQETAERQRIEQQLRQSQKMEAVGTLAGGIAHDFNNILAAIVGFSEMARDRTSGDSQLRRHLDRIFTAGMRGRDLVKQILMFSRQAEQEKQQLRIGSVVNETLKLLRPSLPSTVAISVSTASESGVVLADLTQIQQVILNLCTNAAHAMRRRGGELSIEVADFSFSSAERAPDSSMTPGAYVRLSVSDTGEGIPASLIDRIFDPFFTTKAQGEGTGLGLSVVHGIIASHRGAITVSSEPGVGSTFTVYIPEYEEGRKSQDTGGDAAVPGGKERVLFVDDEEVLAEMGAEILTDLGYDVVSETRSRDALDLLRRNPSSFDLVITDMTMPDITGIELAEEILSVRADMPIVLCTGFSHLVDGEAAKKAGIRAFAMKPLTKREIAQTIRKALDEADN